jgi:ribosomal protein L11 methyltransferase
MKNSNIYELSFHIDSEQKIKAEIIKSLLINSGFDPASLVESSFGLITTVSVYAVNRRKLTGFLLLFKKNKRVRIQHSLRLLRAKDWRDRWKDEFKPFSLTKRIDIVPEKDRKKYKLQNRIPIYLDTTVAFGTGLHETTRFMSGLIESCRGKFNSFFDIGTGTGILSLVALKNDAREVKAVDIDRHAVLIARENFKRNGYNPSGVSTHDIDKASLKIQFDFIAANLITEELIRLKLKILKFVKPGGYLAVSGISLINFPKFKKIFSDQDLRCLTIKKGENWAAVLYQRNA